MGPETNNPKQTINSKRNLKPMKDQTLKCAMASLLPAIMLAFTSCSTIEGTENVTAVETPDGAIIVDTFSASATVTSLDEAKRKVTLEFPDHLKTTYKCGPEVVNFPQIQVGDQVNATVTEEAAIFIGAGAPPGDIAGAGVALAPVGYKPGGELVDTMQVTAKVTAVDAKHHKVTLQFADGTTKKVKVGKKVDLTAVPLGTDVTVQVSEGVAISVGKS
jgi:hypothetical protein